MHVKFFPHGTGDPNKAVAYLLALRDHNGIPRPEVCVLRGNPQLVADLAGSLSFAHRYTSGVISWHADDEPSNEEVQAVLDDFERVAYAGFEADQYSYAAIWHGGHVHVIAARVELRSGLSHNIAPPGRQKAFDHLRDFWNFTKGWARPDDPSRARQIQSGPMMSANLGSLRHTETDELLAAFGVEHGLQGREKRKADVVAYIRKGILDKTLNDRDQVIHALNKIGTVNRIGKDYLSVRFQDDDKPIRLKGTMFDDRFDADAIRSAEATPVHVVGRGRGSPDFSAAEEAKTKLEEAIRLRAIYNQGRYKVRAPLPINTVTSSHGTTALETTTPPVLEKRDDRTGNHFIEEALRAFQISRNAIRKLARACGVAVQILGELDRAGRSFERAIGVFEQFRSALRPRHGNENSHMKRAKRNA